MIPDSLKKKRITDKATKKIYRTKKNLARTQESLKRRCRIKCGMTPQKKKPSHKRDSLQDGDPRSSRGWHCKNFIRNKRPCKNLQGFKVRNFLRKRKILGSEMRTQAFALHSPYEFLFSCERDQERSPKPYKAYGERIRDAVSRSKWKNSIATRLLIHRLGNANASVRASLAS